MTNEYSRVTLLAFVDSLDAPPCSTVMARGEDAGREWRTVEWPTERPQLIPNVEAESRAL